MFQCVPRVLCRVADVPSIRIPSHVRQRTETDLYGTAMPPKQPEFETMRAHLQPGAEAPILREDQSEVGALEEMIAGGGISVHLKNGRLVTVPVKVCFDDLEMIRYHAVAGLTGEHADALWWLREDEHGLVGLKRSWGKVKHDTLPVPLFAPKFPSTAGSKAAWDALLQRAMELHNAGALKGFIACGERSTWIKDAKIWPTLRTIRDSNHGALLEDAEVKALLADVRADADAMEMEDAGAMAAAVVDASVGGDTMEVEIVEEHLPPAAEADGVDDGELPEGGEGQAEEASIPSSPEAEETENEDEDTGEPPATTAVATPTAAVAAPTAAVAAPTADIAAPTVDVAAPTPAVTEAEPCRNSVPAAAVDVATAELLTELAAAAPRVAPVLPAAAPAAAVPAAAAPAAATPAAAAPAAAAAIVTWTCEGKGAQQQQLRGPVEYLGRIGVLLAKGTNAEYYVDAAHPEIEVDASHQNKVLMQRETGGKLQLKFGAEDPVWVTWTHISAAPPVAEEGTARRATGRSNGRAATSRAASAATSRAATSRQKSAARTGRAAGAAAATSRAAAARAAAAAAAEDENSDDDVELTVGAIIRADDATVVKKGTYGKVRRPPTLSACMPRPTYLSL